jgi:hypothetical protein
MLSGIVAPNDFGYRVYAVWYSCSQRFSLSCFMLFGILASNDFGYPVYAVWGARIPNSINRIIKFVGSKNTKQYKQDSQNS